MKVGTCQCCSAPNVYVKQRPQDRKLACSLCIWGDDVAEEHRERGMKPHGPRPNITIVDLAHIKPTPTPTPTPPKEEPAPPPPPPPVPKEPPLSDTGKSRPWTDEERAYLGWALDHLPHKGRVAALLPIFPWRGQQGLRNGQNILRRHREKVCLACRAPVPTPGTRCQSCKDKGKERRQRILREGKCIRCGHALGSGSSATNCADCRQRTMKYRCRYTDKFKERRKQHPTDPRLKSKRILPWPACGNIKWAATLAANTQRPVIDLFGGSGEPLRIVHEFGGQAHHYNDIHPGLCDIARIAKLCKDHKPGSKLARNDEAQAVAQAVHNGNRDHSEAAKTIIDARKPGARNIQGLASNIRRLGRALANASITNEDATTLLQHPEQFPHNAIFLIDPPWPGADQHFDHRLTKDQWAELLDALLDLPDEQDYIILLGAERDALTLASRHMPYAPLFWRIHGALFSRSIVGLSPRLAREDDCGAIGEHRIDLAALGLLKDGPLA